MRIEPGFDAFAARYAAGAAQAVHTRLTADLDTPVSAMLKLAEGRPLSFLFESVEGGEARGRYSILGMKPDLIWRCRDGRAEINRRALYQPDAFEPVPGAPLDDLRARIDAVRMEVPAGLPPMAAGLFGYMSYDMVRLMERLPEPGADPLNLPDAVFLRPTLTAVFDSVTGEVSLVTPVWPDTELTAAAAYARAGERLADAVADLGRSLPRQDASRTPATPLPAPVSNKTHAEYLEIVERAREHIRAGDIFQVVPSQRFAVPFDVPPFALYRALRRLNPSPFLFFLDMDGFSIVGSSPEILVRLRDGIVTIRPIAGTRPRGRDAAQDAGLAAELLNDAKERAEHLMLLDLGRNDVGRVAETGSVNVTESFVIERYSHVMHIVSNIEGRLRADEDALSALTGGFPAGTVSGAPKVRAMEIITELEGEKRGVYGGMVGYFAADGSMDTCIALRTALVKDGIMYAQAGGGVVADSDPEAEYQETVNKARALIRAADEARRFAPAPRAKVS
ncbi:MAG: anthranilate synthase component I [Alphaproteobacteria bacterium]